MARPSLITQWLSDPNSFSPDDKVELAALIATQPFFVPARYIAAAQRQRQQAFDPAMMNTVQLFSGNWLMLYQYLEACETIPQQQVEAPVAAEPEIETVPVVEETNAIPEIEAASAPTHEEHITVLENAPQEVPVEIPQAVPVKEELAEILQEQPVAEVKSEEPVKEELPVAQPKEAIPKKTPIAGDYMVKPLFTEDYFLSQGIEIPDQNQPEPQNEEKDKALMVVMSFSEWLMHFKTKNERDRQEHEDKKALKSMWQKEKLAAAMEEENEEIPEAVFNMAVNSITKEEDLVSESLAEVLQRQGKYDKALDMYRKLSLRNPQKSAYFASKIEQINKQIDS